MNQQPTPPPSVAAVTTRSVATATTSTTTTSTTTSPATTSITASFTNPSTATSSRRSRTTPTSRQRVGRVRGRTRLAATAVAALAIVAGATVGSNPAYAARSSSDEIATQSQEALASLQTWLVSGADDDLVAYQLLRDRTATTIAGAVGVDAEQLRAEWNEVDIINQKAILVAATQVGVPYRYARAEPGVGFDCSGLLLYAYGEVGVDLPRVSYDQIKAGEKVTADEAEPGDLVQYPGHIMIFLGDGVMLHSPNTGSYVEVGPLSTKRNLRYADVTPDGVLPSSGLEATEAGLTDPAAEPSASATLSVGVVTFLGWR